MMLIIPKENETYELYIQRILDSRKNIKDENEYQEKHHIVPKCMDGSNDKDNLIYLYAQEHYYAHKLLALENPENYALQYAWWNMNQCSQNGCRVYDIAMNDYEGARKSFSKMMHGNEYAKGNKLSEDTKAKMSKAHKGKGCGMSNPMYGKHISKHAKLKISEKLSGDKNPSARKVKCIETNEVFNTVKEAEQKYSINHSGIAAMINGRQKSAGKHPETGEKLHWEYIE